MGPMSSISSFYGSESQCEAEEHLVVRAWAQESDSNHPCSSESSDRPASTFTSDMPHVVPCKFIISLAFPVTAGKCQITAQHPLCGGGGGRRGRGGALMACSLRDSPKWGGRCQEQRSGKELPF